ncbi:hypothetical protein [Bradyrhizobium erythrophlei]|uniref:Uncharacterized protein n=1 Tax=Bradyrhizobium erythrophlei TaxID=1437360 RepID=A0A1M7UVF8_9BRAD|nr:hypothetical protein [Bradyrhizobium erythrophlei]SHN86907.1 hypothetical protein SAMN05444170_6908 [Bradyrhizobium erythrophlei]
MNWISKEFLFALSGALLIALIAIWRSPYPPVTTSGTVETHRNSPDNLGADNRSASNVPSALRGSESVKLDESKTGEKPGEDGTEFWPALFGYKLKITDTVIAAFTALLFWATYLLWRATQRLVIGADQTSENQLRAYVSMRGKFVYAFDEKRYCRVRYDIENLGQTPAHNVCHHGDVLVASHPLPDGFAFPSPLKKLTNPFVLFPRLPMEGTQVASSMFSQSEIAAIVAGTARIYLYGEVFYEDIFHKSARATRFALSVVADQATLQKLSTNYSGTDLKLHFETAPIGNTAT